MCSWYRAAASLLKRHRREFSVRAEAGSISNPPCLRVARRVVVSHALEGVVAEPVRDIRLSHDAGYIAQLDLLSLWRLVRRDKQRLQEFDETVLIVRTQLLKRCLRILRLSMVRQHGLTHC